MQEMVFLEHWAGKTLCLMLRACLLFPLQYITELMTRPFLQHFFTSPCVTFHLIFSCQSPCISEEGVTPLLALWSVWPGRKQAQIKRFWGISDKPSCHWILCSKNQLSLLYFLNAVKPLSWVILASVQALCSWSCGLTIVLQQNNPRPPTFILLLGFFEL